MKKKYHSLFAEVDRAFHVKEELERQCAVSVKRFIEINEAYLEFEKEVIRRCASEGESREQIVNSLGVRANDVDYLLNPDRGGRSLFFDSFPSRAKAEEFAAAIEAKFGKNTKIADDAELGADLVPPIVYVERDDEIEREEVEELVGDFSGRYVGT
jgi:hypothetical protein